MISDLGTRLDWTGAVWLTVLTLGWLLRLRSGIPGKLTSFGGFLIILNGILILRWPLLFGFPATREIEYSTRFVIYIIATWLQVRDWQIIRGLTPEEKVQILGAMSLLKLKKKVKVKKEVKEIEQPTSES